MGFRHTISRIRFFIGTKWHANDTRHASILQKG